MGNFGGVDAAPVARARPLSFAHRSRLPPLAVVYLKPERRRRARVEAARRAGRPRARRHRARAPRGRRRPLRGQARRRRPRRWSRPTASPTGTTCSRACCATATRPSGDWREVADDARSATTAGAARSRSSSSAAIATPSRRGSTTSCPGAHEFERRVDAGRHRVGRAASARKLIAEAANRARARATRSSLREWAQARCVAAQDADELAAHRARRGAGARSRSAIPTAAWRRRATAELPRRRRPRARALPRLVRALPALDGAEPGRHGTFARRRGAPALRRGDGLRRAVPAADPSDRPRASARAATTRWPPSPDDVGSPWAIGAREGGHKAIHPAARHARGLPAPRRGRARAAASRSRSTSPSSARPTIRTSSEHPRVVPLAARRHHAVRREPAEEIPGHLSVQLRDRRLAARCGRS